MNRFRILSMVALMLAIGSPLIRAGETKPNVILFLVDDMGWMDSTPYGSKYYETPNMERLAQRALRFTNAYATPLCSPTRASILTGKYSSRHGILTASGHQPPQPPGFDFLPDEAPPNKPIISPISKNHLELSEYTLAEALREAGYRTAHIGKWHLGLTTEHRPDKQGFEFTFECAPDPGPPNYFSPYGVVREGRPTARSHVGNIADGPPGEYITDRITDEALKFIAANPNKPFFLNLWQYGVHGPWGHKEEYTKAFMSRKDPAGRQGNPIMASMLKSVDESLGRLLDKLDELKLTENTLFIFFSDNGGNVHSNTPTDRKSRVKGGEGKAAVKPGDRTSQLSEWRKWAGDLPPTSNAPLRNGKGTLYEGGTRVPLMISWPGITKPGATSDVMVHAIDLYPTVLDVLTLAPHPEQTMDGISFVSVLRDPKASLPRDAIFNFFPMGGPTKPGGVWVRQGDWKLIRWFETGPDYPSLHELYNLRDDLSETTNLAAELPERVHALDALIEGFLEKTGALVPKANPAYKLVPARTDLRPLGGWVPKGCAAEQRDGALIVTGEGRTPFLGLSGLNLAGPVAVTIHAVTMGGAARIQWRTADQEAFPDSGQTIEFTLPASKEGQTTAVEVPVKDTLVHIRLYLPAQPRPVAVDWIELSPAPSRGKPQRWDFDG